MSTVEKRSPNISRGCSWEQEGCSQSHFLEKNILSELSYPKEEYSLDVHQEAFCTKLTWVLLIDHQSVSDELNSIVSQLWNQNSMQRKKDDDQFWWTKKFYLREGILVRYLICSPDHSDCSSNMSVRNWIQSYFPLKPELYRKNMKDQFIWWTKKNVPLVRVLDTSHSDAPHCSLNLVACTFGVVRKIHLLRFFPWMLTFQNSLLNRSFERRSSYTMRIVEVL